MSADSAAHVADLHKIAAEIGPRYSQCTAERQLLAAKHLHEARELIHKAIACYKPEEPKTQQLEFIRR
jgi:hypothetical protein